MGEFSGTSTSQEMNWAVTQAGRTGGAAFLGCFLQSCCPVSMAYYANGEGGGEERQQKLILPEPQNN